MRSCPYVVNTQPYTQYYLDQAGGQIPVYIGKAYQRGYGFGRLLATLFRKAAPLVRQGLKTAKPLIKQGLKKATPILKRSGKKFIRDIVKGKNLKQSARNRALESLDILTEDNNRKRKKSPNKTKNKKSKQDIFD